MKLYIGGTCQGKTAWIIQNLGLNPEDCSPEEALRAPAVNHYHLLVKNLLNEGADPKAFTARLISENPDAVVICDEIGMGIVPTDPDQRIWREAVGRCLKLLAAASESVSRIYAGIEVRIKP